MGRSRGGLDTTGETLNGELLLWDVATGELIHRLDQPVINAVFSPDGQQALISVPGLGRNDVHLWNVEMGDPDIRVGCEQCVGIGLQSG